MGGQFLRHLIWFRWDQVMMISIVSFAWKMTEINTGWDFCEKRIIKVLMDGVFWSSSAELCFERYFTTFPSCKSFFALGGTLFVLLQSLWSKDLSIFCSVKVANWRVMLILWVVRGAMIVYSHHPYTWYCFRKSCPARATSRLLFRGALIVRIIVGA